MSEHTWFDEHLAGYHASGLTAEERERFERHAADCQDCARSLDDWTGFDRSLDDLFAEVRPEAGWESRLLQGLRTAPPKRRWRWTRGLSIAAAIAALVLLGAIGAVMQSLLENDNLPFPGLWAEGPRQRTQMSNNLKQIALVDNSDSMNDGFKKLPPAMRTDRLLTGLSANGTTHYGLSFTPDGRKVAMGDGSVRSVQIWDGTSNSIEFFEPPTAFPTRAPSRIHTSSMEGGEIGGKQDRRELEGRDRGLVESDEQRGKKQLQDLVEREKSAKELQVRSEKLMDELNESRRTIAKMEPGKDPLVFGDIDPAAKEGKDISFGFDVQRKAISVPGQADVAPGAGTPAVAGRPKAGPGGDAPAYFKPPDKREGDKVVTRKVNPSEKPKYTVASGKPQKKEPDSEVAAGEKGQPPAGGRKIVRSGNVDYEVDSFDKTAERINKLIDAIKGAFVEDTTKDKLPNNKMKGSVVVRMPPESLNKFLGDLAKELGKTGELKSMRIGSQDITKQYTDVESRLKAAKTLEERLLQIIKTGKGEIKDLVVAEEKLGQVRTKIEEMEGEIRFYNNQVSLSKLTIGLVEKDIQAASTLQVTEKIKMRIEVEEVEKAQGTVLDEVKKADGRILKSDLKLHGAGQLEAIMIFEAKPEKVPQLRKTLRQIGNITKDEAERQQTAVGGSEPAGNIKPQVKDTHFEVSLYNLANIQPRETITLTVATLDVPGSYKKLQEAVQGKGKIKRGQFNEQNKLNINAVLDFDLHVKDRPGIDKLLTEVGKEIGRSTEQAQPSDSVTDQKVGYRLTLRSVTSIPPREKITLAIEVKNVEQTTSDMVDAIKSHKGLVANGPLFTLDPRGQVRAVILFDVPFAAKDELVKEFKATGTVRLQKTEPNAAVPDNELATAHIDVALSSVGPIISGEDALGPQLRKSLFYSFKIFSISLSFVLLGILGILPPLLVLFVAFKLVRKWRKAKTAT
jgi:anti-sigma factor RsiW